MAAGVAAQYAKVFLEGGKLGIPHRKIGTEGIGEEQGLSVIVAGGRVVDSVINEFNKRHERYSLSLPDFGGAAR